jgi:hypothetical protein
MADQSLQDVKTSALSPWDALSNLVEACEGEVGEVFGGELRTALEAARVALLRREAAERAISELASKVTASGNGRVGGSVISIDLPADAWFSILSCIQRKPDTPSYGAEIGRILKTLVTQNPSFYRVALGAKSERDWFVNEIVRQLGGQVPTDVVAETVAIMFEVVHDMDA